MYEELSEEDLTRLAVRHTTRGQKIPSELMAALKDLGIDEYFKAVPDEADEDDSD